MSHLIQPFNPQEYNQSFAGGGGCNIPLGEHMAILVGHEVKGTKTGEGGYLAYEVQAVDGPAAGMKGTWRLNLYNQSQEAVRIAHEQLSALCMVLGWNGPLSDPAALYNRPFTVVVGTQKNDPQQRAEIKGVKNGPPSAMPSAQQSGFAPPQSAGLQPPQGAQQPPQGQWSNQGAPQANTQPQQPAQQPQGQQPQQNGQWQQPNNGQQPQPQPAQQQQGQWGNQPQQQPAQQQNTQPQQPQGGSPQNWNPQAQNPSTPAWGNRPQ